MANEVISVDGCRPELQGFVVRMEKKLRANDHKGGWTHERLGLLMGRLRMELIESHDALSSLNAALHTSEDPDEIVDAVEHVRDELADVANFCMMVAGRAHWLACERLSEISQGLPGQTKEDEDG